MIKALHQIVDGFNRIVVETLVVDDLRGIVVDSFAYSSHEGFILCDAPQNELVLYLVLVIVVREADLWVLLLPVSVVFSGLLQVEVMCDRVHKALSLCHSNKDGYEDKPHFLASFQ